MKDKVVKFINSVKDAFTRKQRDMGKLRYHQPFVAELAEDTKALSGANDKISSLDEDKANSFGHSLLSIMIEMVVPIFRKWQVRFVVINNKDQADNQNHMKAFAEFSHQKELLFALVDEINSLSGDKLVDFDESIHPAGRAIIKAYSNSSNIKQNPQQTNCTTQNKPASLTH